MGEMILCKLTLAYVKTTLLEKERKKRYYGRPCPMRAVAIKLDRLFAHVHVHVHTEELMGEQPRQRIVRTTSKLAVCTYDERKKTEERNHSRRRRGERERVCVCVCVGESTIPK